MWEMITTMIERMATDRLWIYTGIAGSIFGAIFVAWIAKFSSRKMGMDLVSTTS